MNLITKYKLFENNKITDDEIHELINNYLFNKDFISFFSKNDFELNFDYNIKFIQSNSKITLKLVHINAYSKIELYLYNYGKNDFFEVQFSVKIFYNNYELYDRYIQLETKKNNLKILNSLKELFINLNKEIITTPFKGSIKDIDNLESFMNILSLDKRYSFYVSLDALERYRKLNPDPDIKKHIPDEYLFLLNIKFMEFCFDTQNDFVYLYVKFDHGSEMIKIHEQYIYNVYKLYKKIANI